MNKLIQERKKKKEVFMEVRIQAIHFDATEKNFRILFRRKVLS